MDLKEKSRYLNLKHVEQDYGIPNSSLSKYLKGDRGLSEEVQSRLDRFWDDFTRGTVTPAVSNPVQEKPVKEKKLTKKQDKNVISVGDLVDKSGWKQVFGRYVKKDGMSGELIGGMVKVTSV